MNRTSPPFRAEHIGSLLRPAALLAARRAHAAAEIGDDALMASERDCIADVVKLQEDAGLQLVTDGEFRRGTYSDSFTTSGIAGMSIALTEEQGWSPSQTHGHRTARRIPEVVDRIVWTGSRNAEDFRFLSNR